MDTETTDSSQKSETSLLEIHSKIKTSGEKLYSMMEQPCVLGVAETGPSLSRPLPFTDVEPLTWKRANRHEKK